MENYSEAFSWSYDQFNRPCCPSRFEDGDCILYPRCPFSHEAPRNQYYVNLPYGISNNPYDYYPYLAPEIVMQQDQPIMTDEYPLGSSEFEDGFEEPGQKAIENEVEEDIDQIDYLIKEMMKFEAGPELQEESMMCPFLKETGNCLIRKICPYLHSTDQNSQIEIERKQQWYPASMTCECCRGYIYDCTNSECKDSGSCKQCPPEITSS